MDDVTFGRNGSYSDAWRGVAIPGRSLISMNALCYDANVAYAVGCRLSSDVRPIGLRRMIGIYG